MEKPMEGRELDGCGLRPSPTLRVLDLFSGIGGFALAFEAAGFQTVAFSEIEPYPCKILAQHWPNVPNLGDVRTIDGDKFRGTIDVICGGFPCQDISTAGKGAGIHGARSGLWFEMLRIIRGARPAFCLLENVPALRSRGADVVLGGLEEAGYACRAFVVGAGNAGAPHQRARAWLVAYAYSRGFEGETIPAGRGAEGQGTPVPDWMGQGMEPNSASEQMGVSGQPRKEADHWAVEPALGRVVHGLPDRAHRIKALGNSIVPAVAYPFALWISMQLRAQPSASAAKPSQLPPVTSKFPHPEGQP